MELCIEGRITENCSTDAWDAMQGFEEVGDYPNKNFSPLTINRNSLTSITRKINCIIFERISNGHAILQFESKEHWANLVQQSHLEDTKFWIAKA